MIHRVRIQNFRSILDVTVELSPLTVLVGKSGAGKSNFVHALRLLRDVISSQDYRINQGQSWEQLRPATMPEASTGFEVDFSIAGIDDRFKYTISWGKSGPQDRPVVERLNLGDKLLFEQRRNNEHHQSQWVKQPELLQVPDPGSIALGRIPSISEVVIAYTALTSGIGCYAFSDDVLCGGKQDHSLAGLNDEASNYLEALKEIVSNLQDLNVRKSMISALQRVNPSVSAVELNDIRQPRHVVVGHKFNGKTLTLQLAQESDGFRRFYAHLLALYQQPSKQTLIFEHPEDGIHPGALSLLAEEFKAAPKQSRGQVILTTHSPRLLDEFDADEIRVVELDGFQTRIGKVSSEQSAAIHDDLLSAGELLTTDPARRETTAP